MIEFDPVHVHEIHVGGIYLHSLATCKVCFVSLNYVDVVPRSIDHLSEVRVGRWRCREAADGGSFRFVGEPTSRELSC